MSITASPASELPLVRPSAPVGHPVVFIGPPNPDGGPLPTLGGRHVLAMQAVVERYRRPAIALAARICGATLAEDVVQDAFLSIWRSSGTYRPERGSIGAWVLGVVRNSAIDALRRDARHTNRRETDDAVDSVADPERTDAIVADRDQARSLRLMLGALPADQARVISLAYFDELTHAEIAELTGVPLGTVKGRIRLGLAKLREPLDAAGSPRTNVAPL